MYDFAPLGATALDRLMARIAENTIFDDGQWRVSQREDGSYHIHEVEACGPLTQGEKIALARLIKNASLFAGPVIDIERVSRQLLNEAGYSGPPDSPASARQLRRNLNAVEEVAGSGSYRNHQIRTLPVLYSLTVTLDQLCAYLVANNVIAESPNPARLMHFWRGAREVLATVRGTALDVCHTYPVYARAHPDEVKSGVAALFYIRALRRGSGYELPERVRKQFHEFPVDDDEFSAYRSCTSKMPTPTHVAVSNKKQRTYPLTTFFATIPIYMPRGANLLQVIMDGNTPVLLADVNPTAAHGFRRIHVRHMPWVYVPDSGQIKSEAEYEKMLHLGTAKFQAYPASTYSHSDGMIEVDFFDGGEM